MTNNKTTLLRQLYHSILGQKATFDEFPHTNIDDTPVKVLKSDIETIRKEFPDLLPKIDIEEFFSHSSGSMKFYKISGIKSFISQVLGRLKIEIDNHDSTPITETRNFPFVKNSDLQAVLTRDYSEIQRAYISKCWKSVIILCGGLIEAILTDLLLENKTLSLSSSNKPKENDITRWGLSDLINVSVDIKLVSSGIEKLSHAIREYRNLIHPGVEIRKNLKFDAEEARIAIEVLNILYRDLSKEGL